MNRRIFLGGMALCALALAAGSQPAGVVVTYIANEGLLIEGAGKKILVDALFRDDIGYAPPATPTEELLADIWQQLLGVERIGIYDNFFDAGGHSLLVPQVFARIEDVFQIALPLRILFAAPTIAQMANSIEELLLAQIEELSDEEAASLVDGSLD